jgi:hypothetical protein
MTTTTAEPRPTFHEDEAAVELLEDLESLAGMLWGELEEHMGQRANETRCARRLHRELAELAPRLKVRLGFGRED